MIDRERLTEIDRERKRLTKKERLREREKERKKDGWLSPGLSSLHWWAYRL